MTRRLYRTILVALALYWVTIFILTHIPVAPPTVIRVDDKLQHFAAYFLLAVLLNLAIGQRFGAHRDWMTLAIVMAYGALDEWLQLFVGRSAELLDWYADVAGGAAGVVACAIMRGVYGLLFRGRRREKAELLAESQQR